MVVVTIAWWIIVQILPRTARGYLLDIFHLERKVVGERVQTFFVLFKASPKIRTICGIILHHTHNTTILLIISRNAMSSTINEIDFAVLYIVLFQMSVMETY